jgi:ribonuclease D
VHGIDVETAGNNGGGALTPEEGRLRLVQISDGRQTDIYDAFLDDAEVIHKAVEARKELVAHNAVFEREWLNVALDLDRPDLHDTMIMSQVYYTGTRASQNGNFSHSLAAVVKREIKRELSKDEQTSDWGAPGLRREQIAYAARDAAVLPKLAETLMRKIDKAGLRKTYELEQRVSHTVAAMERYGAAIHRDRLENLIAEATEKAEMLELFAQLIRTGRLWNLEPPCPSTARHLFDDGYITPAGKITQPRVGH